MTLATHDASSMRANRIASTDAADSVLTANEDADSGGQALDRGPVGTASLIRRRAHRASAVEIGPTRLGLRSHAEGQTDPRADRVLSLGDSVRIVQLGLIAHDQQAAG